MTVASSGQTADTSSLVAVQQIIAAGPTADYAIGTLYAPFCSRLTFNIHPQAFVTLVRPLRLPAYHRPPTMSGEEAFTSCHFSRALGSHSLPPTLFASVAVCFAPLRER